MFQRKRTAHIGRLEALATDWTEESEMRRPKPTPTMALNVSSSLGSTPFSGRYLARVGVQYHFLIHFLLV